VHSYGDFQVTPDGDVALFNSALSLTGYSNLGHLEIYRYDANLDALTCPSCAPSLTPASADTTLSLQGLNLTNDGRVFFTTPESFVLRDSNRRLDVYEWKEGTVQLISTGISAEDATLLSVSHDGVDAYFFTRDKLVENDANGGAVRIYDAREHGGFFIDPPPKRCAASDECHGAGTPAPPPPNITTRTGSEQIVRKAAGCRKGFVKRHGRCVKKKKKRKRQHRRRGQRNG
jgi:hypothetical protein